MIFLRSFCDLQPNHRKITEKSELSRAGAEIRDFGSCLGGAVCDLAAGGGRARPTGRAPGPPKGQITAKSQKNHSPFKQEPKSGISAPAQEL